MTGLIGGLRLAHYENLLSVPNEKKQKNGVVNSSRSISKSHLKSTSLSLEIIFKRCLYAICHPFHWPSDAYLFKRFKSHQFELINNRQDYEHVVQVFQRFEALNKFSTQLELIRPKIDAAKVKLDESSRDVSPTKPKENIEPQSLISEKKAQPAKQSKRSVLTSTKKRRMKKIKRLQVRKELIQYKGNPIHQAISSSTALLDHLIQLTKAIQDLELWKKMNTCRLEQGVWPNQLKNFIGGSNKPSHPLTLPQDKEALNEVEKVLKEVVKSSAAYYRLLTASAGDMTKEKSINISEHFIELYSGFEKMVKWLKDAHHEQGLNDVEIFAQLERLEKIVNRHLAVEYSADSFVSRMKGWTTAAVGNTFSYLMQESYKKKDLEWKVEKYETLLKQLNHSIENYLAQAHLPPIQEMVEYGSLDQAEEWQKKLLPILEIFLNSLQLERDRFTPLYLKKLRDAYQGFLNHLREAAKWAADNQNDPGALHIDSICYHFYTHTNLNECALDILETFCQLGKESVKGKPIKFKYQLSEIDHFLIKDLELIDRLIHAVPNSAKAPQVKQWFNSLLGHVNGLSEDLPFDPNKQSNPVHALFKWEIHQGGKIHYTQDIGMGTPTIEKGKGKVEINPEYQGYQRCNQRLDKKHFYINYQNFKIKNRLKGSEAGRCQAIHQEAEKRPGTLFTITLTRNSLFYEQKAHSIIALDAVSVKQQLTSQLLYGDLYQVKPFLSKTVRGFPAFRGEYTIEILNRIHKTEFKESPIFTPEEKKRFIQTCYREIIEQAKKNKLYQDFGYTIYFPQAEKFKQELIAQFFDGEREKTGNYIPTELVDKYQLKGWTKKAIDLLQAVLMNNREELTLKETKYLIDLTELLLSVKLIVELKVDAYNASCKDRIDRGAVGDAALLIYLLLLNDLEKEKALKSFLEMMIFVRAIMVRKRTIITERLDRFIELAKFMLDHKEQMKRLHQELFPGVKITLNELYQSLINKGSKSILEDKGEDNSLNQSITSAFVLVPINCH